MDTYVAYSLIHLFGYEYFIGKYWSQFMSKSSREAS